MNMKRREFITLVGVAAVIGPSTVRAEQAGKLPTIGFLGPARWAPAFEQRLRELGWIAGRTVAIEYRSAEGRTKRLAEIATELVRLEVNVVVTVGGSPTLAVQHETSLIPIVFIAGDPVGSGLVASLARPGGNTTGERSTRSVLPASASICCARLSQVSAACRLWSMPIFLVFRAGWMRYRRRPPRSALRRRCWNSGAPRMLRRPSRPSRTVRTHCMSSASHSPSPLPPWRWPRGFQRCLNTEALSTRA